MPDNPYQSPIEEPATLRPGVDLRRAAIAFVLWLVLGSALRAAVLALMTARALFTFGAEVRTAALVAVSAARYLGPQMAASAAAIALAAATRPSTASTPARRMVPFSWLFAAVLPATPIAIAVMVAAGLAIASLTRGIPTATSWRTIAEIVEPSDIGFGMACACASALLLGVLGAFAAPRLRAWRRGLLARILAALLVTVLVYGLVVAAAIAVWAPLTPVVPPP